MGSARTPASRTMDVVLTIAAVLGTLAVAGVIASAVFGVRIVLFSTGSMSPSLPAGTAALVREVDADEARIGDVVTIMRPNELPITHRVVDIADPPDASGPTRELSLRGDANDTDDPFPYRVERVGLLLFGVPGIAPVIAALSTPWALGTITVLVAGLVLWTFWPRRPGPDPAADADARSDADADARSDADPPADAVPSAEAGTSRRARRAGIGIVVALALCGGGLWADAREAAAAPVETVASGEVVTLTAIGDPDRMLALRAGDSVEWIVGIGSDASRPGSIDVTMSGAGDVDLSLRYALQVCDRRWIDAGCSGTARLLVTDEVLPTDGVARPLLELDVGQEAWLRYVVTMPADVGPDVDGAVRLIVRATGMGDDVKVSPPFPGDGGGAGAVLPLLPRTGGGDPWPLAWAGLGLLAVGGAVAASGRRRADRVRR